MTAFPPNSPACAVAVSPAGARRGRCVRAAALALSVFALHGPAPAADDQDAKAYVAFVEDFASTCVSRNGVQVLVKSTHPSRKLRVWLDRYHMGVGTGDRSRTDLLPDGTPEALGCSRTTTGVQEWRIVRATWID